MMISAKFLKGSLAATALSLVLFFPTAAAPLSTDISVTARIGSKGGNVLAEDPATGMSVNLSFPAGALTEETEITLLIHGTRQPGVLLKCHINGISVLPTSLWFQEKVEINIYNPPEEVTEAMVAYRVVNSQFNIPLGNHEQHIDEGWISGTIYSTGRFSLGTPTATEVTAQCRKLAAYNPARPLTYADEESDTPFRLTEELNELYEFHSYGGPYAGPPDEYLTAPACALADDEECMRWQKALTQVEAHITWVEQHRRTGNTEGVKSEEANAKNALQEAIDGYLKKASPANRCGSYIKAAAKYLESATLLGMNIEGESQIAKHFNQLVDECSFVFTVEKQEWIDKPKEKREDGSTYEEKATYYKTIKCYTPWNEFLATGTQKIRGEGTMSLHYENHWVGDEKNDHTVTDGSWRVEKIEGGIQQYIDDHGEQTMLANMSVYWKKDVTSHAWGKVAGGKTYDFSNHDDESFVEHVSYNIENGYTEKNGTSEYGFIIRIFILKAPGDGRDDPDDCF
ncbi:MAG: hypothetical protein E4H43_01860 [Bacteroidia bacterium]|nr:MAG: hypothetical protein E4H43_01860 [Bacteroidia bacterium]